MGWSFKLGGYNITNLRYTDEFGRERTDLSTQIRTGSYKKYERAKELSLNTKQNMRGHF